MELLENAIQKSYESPPHEIFLAMAAGTRSGPKRPMKYADRVRNRKTCHAAQLDLVH